MCGGGCHPWISEANVDQQLALPRAGLMMQSQLSTPLPTLAAGVVAPQVGLGEKRYRGLSGPPPNIYLSPPHPPDYQPLLAQSEK